MSGAAGCAAVLLVRRDAVDDAIGADFGGVLVQDRHAGVSRRARRSAASRRSSAPPSCRIVPVSGGTTEPSTTPRDRGRVDAAVREQPVDQQAEFVGGPLAQRLQPPALDRACRRRTRRARCWCCRRQWLGALESSVRMHGYRARSRPLHFSGDDALRPIADPHEQRAVVVDAGRDARLRTARRRPRHARAAAARRARAPRVENSIEPRRRAGRRSGAPAPPASRADRSARSIGTSELRFERRRAIAQLGGIRRRAHVDAVAEHDRLQLGRRRRATPSARIPASFRRADEQIVRPLDRRRQTGRRARRLPQARRRPRASASAVARSACRTRARRREHDRDIEPAPGGENQT